jgi:hypothetical protein
MQSVPQNVYFSLFKIDERMAQIRRDVRECCRFLRW